MFAAQLLEQFKAAAVRQHHIQYYRGGLILRQRLLRALPVMAGMGDEAFLCEPADQQLAQLLIIIDKQQFAHVCLLLN